MYTTRTLTCQILRFWIFERLEFSVSYVKSTALHIPTPPASNFFAERKNCPERARSPGESKGNFAM